MDTLQDLLTLDDEPAGIGHNSAGNLAALREQVDDEIAPLRARLASILEAAHRLPPELMTRDLAANVADAMRMLAAAKTALDETRKATKAPFLEAGKLVDALFGPAQEIARQAEETMKPKLIAYLAAKADVAEGGEKTRIRGPLGSVATLSRSRDVVIDDIHALDLDALRLFIDRAALEKALRAAVTAGVEKIAGASIYPVNRLVVR